MALPNTPPPASDSPPLPPRLPKRTGWLRALFALKHSFDGLRTTRG